MSRIHSIFYFLLAISLLGTSCTKSVSSSPGLTIPNGDFELWDSQPKLLNWQTNSCPMCMVQMNMYLVQKDSLAYTGQWGARFVSNFSFPGIAQQTFAIDEPTHAMSADIRSNMTAGDTASIKVYLISNKQVFDSGIWYETSSTPQYKTITIPFTPVTGIMPDSAKIIITGGKKVTSSFTVDYLYLVPLMN